jgi:hypothetical protein
MANSNFVVQNGLTVGPLSIDAFSGNIVSTGTLTIDDDAYIGGNLTVLGTTSFTSTQTTVGIEIVGGNLVANSGTSSTSVSNGALVVIGGAGISGNLNVGGNVTNTAGVPVGYTYTMDDISTRFDGQTTTFPITIDGGTAFSPNSPIQLQVEIGGLRVRPARYYYDLQNLTEFPVFTSGYQVVGSNIVFANAPLRGTPFFGTVDNNGDRLPTFSYSPTLAGGRLTPPFSALNIMFGA